MYHYLKYCFTCLLLLGISDKLEDFRKHIDGFVVLLQSVQNHGVVVEHCAMIDVINQMNIIQRQFHLQSDYTCTYTAKI